MKVKTGNRDIIYRFERILKIKLVKNEGEVENISELTSQVLDILLHEKGANH